jgi:hypothetical protein
MGRNGTCREAVSSPQQVYGHERRGEGITQIGKKEALVLWGGTGREGERGREREREGCSEKGIRSYSGKYKATLLHYTLMSTPHTAIRHTLIIPASRTATKTQNVKQLTSSSFPFGTLHMQLVPKFVSLVWMHRRQQRFS